MSQNCVSSWSKPKRDFMRLSVTSLSSSDTLFNSLRGQAGASRAHKRIRISRIASVRLAATAPRVPLHARAAVTASLSFSMVQSLCQSSCKSMFSQFNKLLLEKNWIGISQNLILLRNGSRDRYFRSRHHSCKNSSNPCSIHLASTPGRSVSN